MPKVLIAPLTLANLQGPWLDVLREAGFELVFPPRAKLLTESELMDVLPEIVGVLAGSEPYNERVLKANPQLKVIARAGVGYDAVDVKAATERGVVVTITPGANQDAVAEFTFAVMLSMAKNIIPDHLAMKSGSWPRQANLPLRGRTLGIIGMGRIGKAVAIRGKVFGMKMVAYEPMPDKAFCAEYGVTLAPLDTVLAESDYITIHIPKMPETMNLINRRTLELMKPTAYLINTARGGLINEADLYDALKAKRIAGAALDVFLEEPPGKIPLCELDNLVMTPHSAGIDVKSRDDMSLMAAQSIVALGKGEWPAVQIVNPEARARFKW